MDFSNTDIPTEAVSVSAADEGGRTSDANVRNIGAGDAPTPTEMKGDSGATGTKDGRVENLLDLSPGPESSEPISDPSTMASAPQQLDKGDPFELGYVDHDADGPKLEEKESHTVAGSGASISPQPLDDDQTNVSRPQDEHAPGDSNISATPSDFSGQGHLEGEAFVAVRPDEPGNPAFEYPGRSNSPAPDQPIETGVVEPENPKMEPSFHSYLNEPTPKSDVPPSFDNLTPPSTSPKPQLVDDLVNVLDLDTAAQSFDPKGPSHDPNEPSSVEQDPPSLTPEPQPDVFASQAEPPAPTYPQAESPIILEPPPSADAAPATDLSSHNPDPLQAFPPVEPQELGDHRPPRIPSPSSMDAEPPTPVERSTLSELKEEGGRVDELPLDALRTREVQEALAAIIPPAPDKPLPPTPGDEPAAPPPAGGRALPACLGLRRVTVMELLLWRDPKTSAAAFVTGLVVLISMMYFSFISVVAYFSLALLTVTLGFRLYKSILSAVQKTGDGHPFQDLLSVDTTVSAEKGHEMADKVVAELNCCSTTLKDLFLVKDIFESVKFGFALYLLTYVGACFNTMTLVIMAYVAMFTLPKVYEQNKAQIDQVLAQVREKISEISAKVKAAIPMGKKAEPVTEEKKEE